MPRGKRKARPSESLFATQQLELFEKSYQEKIEQEKNKPVECLGMTFPNDEARRIYFLEKLREKLKDPDFRKIEGFPIGSDEDILSMSDPPYYTACPNPFLADFIKCYGKPYDPDEPYNRKPFAVDVSEGKTDPIYKAHSYHTKVPHLAIVPSILHYTEPGDVVLDGFCGSGMTGVAAQWCGSAPESYRRKVEKEFERQGLEKPKWGARRVVLNDLSPAATFIAANYNLPFNVGEFARAGRKILAEVEQELGWMYQTLHVEPASSRLLETIGFLKVVGRDLKRIEQKGGVGQQDSGPTDADPVKEKPDGILRFTRRQGDLPHWQLPGSFYFLTFNTHQRRQLSEASRQIVLDALLHFDGERLNFVAAVVMPDHVHVVLQPLKNESGAWWDLADLLHSIKSYSANQVNKIENTPGATVWQTETYDRIIRDERELSFTLQYMASNPVVAGLVDRAEAYPWFRVGDKVEEAGWKPAPLGRIEYTVWSEVFSCPDCAREVVFLEEALDKRTKRVKDVFPCPHCGSELTKQRLDRIYETRFDPILNAAIQIPKRNPSLIVYLSGGKHCEKSPDDLDLNILNRISALELPAEVPTVEIPPMHMTHERARMDRQGITHLHHFFLPRAAQSIAALWRKSGAWSGFRTKHMLYFLLDSHLVNLSIQNRYRPEVSFPYNPLTGVYYVPSMISEASPFTAYINKIKRIEAAFPAGFPTKENVFIETHSSSDSAIPENSIDYIFTDPPFGENIYYADLNFLVESWHRIITNAEPEAIVDRFKKKGLPEYQRLMQRCFEEYYRVLKPGRWMTVVFHNSRNSVWNAIQEALQAAGFVVADVRSMDKQQGSYRQVTSSAVKQDLVISAYKPNDGLEKRLQQTAGTEESVWDFIRTHLKQLPSVVLAGAAAEKLTQEKEQSGLTIGRMEVVAERQAQKLYDNMVAFHVQRGIEIPLSAAEFFAGLENQFGPSVDGMYFLPEQAAEYQNKRATVRELKQLDIWVHDEASAIEWLRQQLRAKPQTTQDLTPQFMRETQGSWQRHEKPLELAEILDQNFLCYDGTGDVPSQIHSYLSKNYKDMRNLPKDDADIRAKAKGRWYVPDPAKVADLEKIKEKALLKEFKTYKERKQKFKRNERFRTEAFRAGFKKAWQERDYATIIDVGRKIPESVLQEDPKLLMWYDQALTRTGGDL